MLHTNRLVGQTGIGVAIQIAGSSAEHIQVQDNNVFGCGTGASVSTAAPYLVFTGNTFLSQTLRAWDLTNASFLTYYGNTFRNSANATYLLSLLPTSGSNIIKKSWETTVTATLNAGAARQNFTVALPANLFSGTPLCQATLASGAYGLVVAYVYDSSNANTATMRIMNPSGAAIVNGTYRVCLKFTNQNY